MATHLNDSVPQRTAHASAVASRIARELNDDPARCRFAKVTSLSHAFRGASVHSEIGDLLRVLGEHGIAVSSGRSDISRRDVLELSMPSESAPEDSTEVRPRVRASVWRPGEPGRDIDFTAGLPTRPPGTVLWFDVDSTTIGSSPEDSHREVDEIAALLEPWCPELDELIVKDLLTPDLHPKAETYGDERTGVRSVSVAAVVARELPDQDDDFDGVDEQLIFQMLELVVGPGWILTCWHPSRILAGSGEGFIGPSLLREPFLSHVAHRWVHDRGPDSRPPAPKDSGDLARYLARSVVATYGASIRMLQRWVSSWEVDFYKTLSDHDKPRKLKQAASEISSFLAMVGEFHRGVSAFRLAGEELPKGSWFAEVPRAEGATPEHSSSRHTAALRSAVETAEDKLEQLSAGIRADMDLLMIHSQASQQESSERLQAYLGKVTGLVLVPTFVAGLFGANTALPGGGSWMGFEIMLLLMAISAAASYFVIRKLIN